jgi:hypothetical protein
MPKDGECVMLKVHVTSIGGIIDKEETVLASYMDGKWIVNGEQLIENDYPIMRTPVAWTEN